MEQHTKGAFESRRELTKLLVEKVVVGHDREGQPEVDVTYRFEAPERFEEDSAPGVYDSEEFSKAHGRSGAGC